MNGKAIICTGLAVLFMLGVVPLLLNGADERSLRWAIRCSADVAFLFFLIAFVAKPLQSVWKTDFSRWAVRNRRYNGISFALAFLFHGVLIGLLAIQYPQPFLSQMTAATISHGIISVAITAVLLITSNNVAVRILGRRAWSAIHTIGCYFLLFSFLNIFWLNASKVWLWPFLLVTLLVVALRFYVVAARLYAVISQKRC